MTMQTEITVTHQTQPEDTYEVVIPRLDAWTPIRMNLTLAQLQELAIAIQKVLKP